MTKEHCWKLKMKIRNELSRIENTPAHGDITSIFGQYHQSLSLLIDSCNNFLAVNGVEPFQMPVSLMRMANNQKKTFDTIDKRINGI